jgi:F-type H+-transporting ATPase subunit gamma
MANTRDIKRRIKSVSNIKQITHAMQLVATSKMKRAGKRSADADAYAYGALEVLENITRCSEEAKQHPYWKGNPESNKVGIVVISTDRGFCGGLNVLLTNELAKRMKEMKKNKLIVEAITVGKKGRDAARKFGIPIAADFSGIGDHFSIKEIRPIAHLITKDYIEGKYQKIHIMFSQFVNTLVQRLIVRQILPVSIAEFEDIAEIDEKREHHIFKREYKEPVSYIFEPTIDEIFENIVPHLTEVGIYKALLENQASEHSARMIAMKNATEKAGELIDDFTLAYNGARQAAITTEIAEISSGAMTT